MIGTLGVESAARQRLGHRRYLPQRQALLDILTAQWATYVMYDLQEKRPDGALEWAHQALDDAQHARNSLPTYYYPSYLVGSIHDLCGNCYIRLSERAPDNETYRSLANKHFQLAADAFAKAESLLETLARSETFRHWDKDEQLRHRVETVRVARLKDQLLVDNGLEGLTAFANTEILPFDLESTVNAACLFAVAAWVADENGRNASRYRLRACQYVVEAVRQNPSVGFLRKDKDLNRGIARADLDWLLDHALKVDDQTIDERLRVIATCHPSPAPTRQP